MEGDAPFMNGIGVRPWPRLHPRGERWVLSWLGFSMMASSSSTIMDAVKKVSSSADAEPVSPGYLFGMYLLWITGMVIMLLPVMLPNSPHVTKMGALVAVGMMWFMVAP